MAFGFDDILIGLAIGAGTAGVGAALSPKAPKAPNASAATVAGVQADLDTLPMRRQIEAAARLGKKVTVQTGASTPIYEERRMVNTSDSRNPNWVPYNAAEWAAGGKYAGLGSPQVTVQKVQVGSTPTTQEYDFTGRGDIDNQVDLANKMAATTLATQKKYGVEFARTGVEQEELADPEGTAARRELYARIMAQAAKVQARPVSEELRNQITTEAAAGSGLDSGQKESVRRAIIARMARGDTPPADIEAGIATRMDTDLDTRRQGKLLNLLTSGTTPDDARFRKEVQDRSNLGAYLSGENPVAQFSQLSGAQHGTTPIARAPSLTNVNPNAGAAGREAALGSYSSQMQYAKTQANPWMAGISLALKGAATAGQAGWKPVG